MRRGPRKARDCFLCGKPTLYAPLVIRNVGPERDAHGRLDARFCADCTTRVFDAVDAAPHRANERAS